MPTGKSAKPTLYGNGRGCSSTIPLFATATAVPAAAAAATAVRELELLLRRRRRPRGLWGMENAMDLEGKRNILVIKVKASEIGQLS